MLPDARGAVDVPPAPNQASQDGERREEPEHQRVPGRPPWRCREEHHIVGRAKKYAKARRRTGLERIDASDRHDRPVAKACRGRFRARILQRLEHRVAELEHQGPSRRRRDLRQQHGVDRDELRVAGGGQRRLWCQGAGGRRRNVADATDDCVLQRRVRRADHRESRDVDDVARRQLDRLFRLDQGGAGRIADVDAVPHFPRTRVHRDVLDEHGLPHARPGDGAAQPHPAIELVHRVMGEQARDRADLERPGRRSAGLDERIRSAAREECHAAHLTRLVVQCARGAAQPQAGVDEPREILGRKVPEPRADQPTFDRDVDEQGLAGLGNPGPLAHPDRLDVLTVEHAAEECRVRHAPGWGQRRVADRPNAFGHYGRGKSFARRDAVDLDDVAGMQLDSRVRKEVCGAIVHEHRDASVVNNNARGLAFVDVGDRSAYQYAMPLVRDLRRQRPDSIDRGERGPWPLRPSRGVNARRSDRAAQEPQRGHRGQPARGRTPTRTIDSTRNHVRRRLAVSVESAALSAVRTRAS